ncbi:MAG: hypothetical protein NTZ98_08010 [Acidobacteria bacterium]|nr:hypothetical protein [Acidobacteriota bacterium]
MKHILTLTALLLAPLAACHAAEEPARQRLGLPVTEGRWLRPAGDGPALPAWGHADGLRVGLAPIPGPRGLLRIYAPYLGQAEGRVINYIAVEPVSEGTKHRGYSELEKSGLDGISGKRFWSADAPADATPRDPARPSRGRIVREGEVEMLRVFVFVEPFENGARPYLQLTFRSDRPHEVGLAVFAQAKSQPMSACVLTATMGNYARLRRLHLARRTVAPSDLWPEFDGNGFAPHARFGLPDLVRTPEGHVLAAATSDEAQPDQTKTPPGWKYQGRPATQYWRCETPGPQLAVQVNGRKVYWGGSSPIPGGTAYENFEMFAPFSEGQEFWFGVTPETPKELGLAAPARK